MSLRVHVAGMRSGTDPGANLRAACHAVSRAADGGAGLVVLPEYAAAFDPRRPRPDLAEPLDGPFLTGLHDAAASTGVVVVAGTLLPGSAPGRAVNVVAVVTPEGVAGTYRKVHLYDAFGQRESESLDAGPADAAPVVVDVAGLQVGVMTCYDLRFPESARRLVDAGATVIVVPAAWAAGPAKADQWRTLLRARAIEDVVYVLGATQEGPGVTGPSMVVDPWGAVLAEAEGSSEDRALAVADLDPRVVSDARERNPSLVNRRYTVVPRV